LGIAYAADMVGIVKIVRGSASIVRDEQTIPAKAGNKLFEKDSIKTGADGSIGVIFSDNSLLSIGSNSDLQINEFLFRPADKKLSIITRIKRGTLTYITGLIAKLRPESVKFQTPTAILGVRGTHFAIRVKGE